MNRGAFSYLNLRDRSILRMASALFIGCILNAVLVASSLAQNVSVTSPTVVNIGTSVQRSSVKRLGLNLGGQGYWDSSQLLRNLVSRNPGFEGEMWQSTIHCKAVTSTSCTDDNAYEVWPANFFAGATGEFIYGANTGQTVTITSNTKSNGSTVGVTLNFAAPSQPLAVGDYIVVRMNVPGNALGGWWSYVYGGASLGTDLTDLSPESPGKQALSMNASGASQGANVSSYFDTAANGPFIQMKGSYTLSFRAKGMGGSNKVSVSVQRAGVATFFNTNVNLSNSWQDYSYTFSASDTGAPGTVSLSFTATGSSLLLDDVALSEVSSSAANNPTVFRDEVVSTLRTLNPGILRYMDSGGNWGSSLDNMLTPAFARLRTGYSDYSVESDDIPIGLHDFLVLCQAIGAEPWYTMQTGMSTQEMSNLMDYLGGSTATPYGARRAALGQTAPWTSVFKTIHLEFGNEVWNSANSGDLMTDEVAYGKRAGTLFGVARASSSYSQSSFDLVVDGFAAVPWWNQQVLAASANYDTIDIAPYLFNSFKDDSSTEAIFGPMFAQPEMLDSTSTGVIAQQAQVAAAAARPAKLAVYESNLSATQGTVSQTSINLAVPSIGAGIASTEHMLLMMRDLGIMNQNMFTLAGYQNSFYNTVTGASSTTPLWGSVIDMGNTNRKRPTFLTEQLANSAILPTMLATTQAGTNPTWNQPLSANDSIALNGAHYIQSFAFTDGTTNNLILFNLNRTQALPVSFSGANAPWGNVSVQTLTSKNITDNNETAQNVGVVNSSLSMTPGQIISLPPFSMTVLTSSVPPPSAITVSCSPTSITTNANATCTASSSSVTWSTDSGSITASGVYTAPSIAPTSGTAKITATSIQNPSVTAVTSIGIKTPVTVNSVAIACGTTSLVAGTSASCTATVSGTGAFSSGVTWSANVGTISSTGVYSAPAVVSAATNATITATSTQDTTKSAMVTLSITPIVSVQSVSATCTPMSLAGGAVANCVANVAGTGSFSSAVSWKASVGTISSAGLYTAPATVSANSTVAITATSIQDTSKSSTVMITLTAPSVQSVAVNCGASSLSPSGSTPCSATVTGLGTFNSSVSWKASLGTVSGSGTYTAPTSAAASTMVVVTATSVQDTSKSASFSLAVVLPPAVSSVAINCPSSTLIATTSMSCGATVTGTGNPSTAVTWKTNLGTISSGGAYTAPSTVSTSAVATITATSVQDATKSASFAFTITPLGMVTKVTVSCALSPLPASSRTTCSASLLGVGTYPTNVSWSTTGGSIDQNGNLSAPSTLGPITVTATSTIGGRVVTGTAIIQIAGTPVISSPTVSYPSSTSAVISWKTNGATSNGLDWGIAKSYGSTTPWTAVTTNSPSFTITDLKPGTVYYVLLFSTNVGVGTQLPITISTPNQ